MYMYICTYVCVWGGGGIYIVYIVFVEVVLLYYVYTCIKLYMYMSCIILYYVLEYNLSIASVFPPYLFGRGGSVVTAVYTPYRGHILVWLDPPTPTHSLLMV